MKSKRVSGRLLSSAFCLTLSLGAMTGMAQAKVTDKDIVNDQATPGDWSAMALVHVDSALVQSTQ